MHPFFKFTTIAVIFSQKTATLNAAPAITFQSVLLWMPPGSFYRNITTILFTSTNIPPFWLMLVFFLLAASVALNIYWWHHCCGSRKKGNQVAASVPLDALMQLPPDRRAMGELEQVLRRIRKNNQMLVSLQVRLLQVQQDAGEKQGKELAKMQELIAKGLRAKEDWKQFLSLFQSVEGVFWEALKDAHPNLRPVELRVIALMRLHYKLEDIAMLVNVSEDGVKKSVYRLRKKMGIPAGITLRNYLMEGVFRAGQ